MNFHSETCQLIATVRFGMIPLVFGTLISSQLSAQQTLLYNAVWRPGTDAEIQVYGSAYSDFRAKYDELWPQGWRLHILQTYVKNGQVLYNAVWRPGAAGEVQVYGWAYADLRTKYDSLWPQGWRLEVLQSYVLNGQVRYN